MFLISLYGFFDYKKFIEGYNGQDYFGLTHIIFMFLATLTIVLLCVFLRNASHKSIGVYLKVMAIVTPVLEITKIVWETIWDYKTGSSFNFAGLLPLYTCSMFIYVLPFAAFAKGKVRHMSLAWLTTIGIFGGLTNFYLTQILHTYPFWTFSTFISLYFHFAMVFTGVFLLSSKYFAPKWKDIIYSWIPLVVFSLIVIPVNYILKSKGFGSDYMLYMRGNGAPFLPQIANFFISHNIQFIYTLIVMCCYLTVSTLVISIFKLIVLLSNSIKKIFKKNASFKAN